ncbi:domain of Kin17 curved DNA-binding protein-domain-containing protein [Desarmillaria tabescens]|uniref:Domain of Kin17 curved DNA-binding protein-domain-containing protein n=1 Tax=Armillaria tabescens TaxID=1929756 RepID=A0AA39TKA7_ARMTA|nr:domain of Kin17 curved DNA-binding protein-domain-containing protein [Desarmillaria tabescens]KAK0462057.1 domain of Kin17 curved DNA-binding protein-domain-containing protein [Desarmillaria tabescens]
MPRAEGKPYQNNWELPKYLANKMKSKGLQRLRWYCQVCEKQCRDENGFKCHAASESHLRQMLVVGEHAGKHISNFSSEFQSEFVALLSRRFGTKRVRANQVYQEYISDKHHLHMNSTRWVTLTEFVKHLGRTGVARVDETEKGWFIAWIDNSPKALAKAEASMKKRERRFRTSRGRGCLLQSRLSVQAGEGKNEGAEKLTISFSKPAAESTSSSSAIKIKAAVNPLKANPLKRPNVFKTAAAASSSSSGAQKRSAPMTAAERLILEEQDRKRRRMERENA